MYQASRANYRPYCPSYLEIELRRQLKEQDRTIEQQNESIEQKDRIIAKLTKLLTFHKTVLAAYKQKERRWQRDNIQY